MQKSHKLLLKQKGSFKKMVIIYGTLFITLMGIATAVAFARPYVKIEKVSR